MQLSLVIMHETIVHTQISINLYKNVLKSLKKNQKSYQIFPVFGFGGRVDNVHVVGGVVGLDEGVDGLLDHVLGQLGLAQLGPDRGLVTPLGKLVGPIQIVNIFNEHLNS